MDNFIPKMVTIKEAAKATGLAEYHVRQLCINSEITAVKTGKKYLINLDRFVDYLNTPPASVPVQNQAIRKIAE
ncbi:MAG: excisionase family DNA-binding protein [Hydrogenoanaerobacterium sp.]